MKMLYSFRSLGQTAATALALLLTPPGFAAASAECVDYADYLNWVGSVDLPDLALGVSISGSHASVADAFSGLQVVDITDPTSPKIVGTVDTPGEGLAVSVSGSYACVADGWVARSLELRNPDLQVIDITDPTNPRIVGSVYTPGFAWSVSISGAHAYVANDWVPGLTIVLTHCESPPTSTIDPVDPGQPGLPDRFGLLGANPNPFTASTSIAFDLPVATAVTLRIYDVQGHLVRDLLNEVLSAGRVAATWNGLSVDGRPVVSGTYFYRLQAGELQDT